MPIISPSRGDVHINAPLTNVSVAYLQSASNFVAAKVFINIPVTKQSDAFYTYDRGAFNRDEMTERLPGTESAGGSYTIGNDTYYASVRAFHKDIPDQIRNNADSPIQLDREATEYVTHKGLINRETLWASNFFKSGAPGDIWSFVLDGAATRSATVNPQNDANNDIIFWNDASSTPIEDVRMMKRYVLESTGFKPNVLTFGRFTYDALIDHPDVVGRMDRGQTTGPAIANREALAALFEVDEILIMDAIQNLAGEGQAVNHSFIGGKHALLSYRPSSAGLLTPAAGYTFSWTGHLGAGNDGMRIKRFRQEAKSSDRVEIEMAYAQKLISPDLGAFFDGVVQ